MTSEWPIAIDGDEYQPIPENWLAGGVEPPNNRDGPRLYAVSATVTESGRCLRIRYGHPRSGEVIQRTCNAKLDRTAGTYLPVGLANQLDEWYSSWVPVRGAPEFEALRTPEREHMEEIWGDKLQRPDGLTDGHDGRRIA